MSGASAVSQTPARRAQPTLVFRQIVPPVQPGHALGAALVEGRGEGLFAGLVTTARSCPFNDFVTPWHNVRMPDLGRLPPERSRRCTIAQKERRLLTIVSNGHRALTAERLGRFHEIMRDRAHSRPKPGRCALPDSVKILLSRTSDQIQASGQRCIAANRRIMQTTELVAISRNMLAHSRARLSVHYAAREYWKQ
jgi:hypothetical protein